MSSSNTSNEPSAPRTISTPGKSTGAARWLMPVLALVVAIGLGLFGGILIGQRTGHTSAAAGASAGFRGGAAGGGFGGGAAGGAGGTGAAGGVGGAGGNVTAGTVVSVNGDTVVIKTASGSDVTVTTSSSTKVTKSSASSVSALKAGETVTAIGQTASNGQVSATTISEGTTGFRGFGGARPGAGAAG